MYPIHNICDIYLREISENVDKTTEMEQSCQESLFEICIYLRYSSFSSRARHAIFHAIERERRTLMYEN